jgi:hypothetical protein
MLTKAAICPCMGMVSKAAKAWTPRRPPRCPPRRPPSRGRSQWGGRNPRNRLMLAVAGTVSKGGHATSNPNWMAGTVSKGCHATSNPNWMAGTVSKGGHATVHATGQIQESGKQFWCTKVDLSSHPTYRQSPACMRPPRAPPMGCFVRELSIEHLLVYREYS